LAAVVSFEVGAEVGAIPAERPAGLAIGRLNFDHLSAKVGEEHGGEGPLLVAGEVENADVVERSGHGAIETQSRNDAKTPGTEWNATMPRLWVSYGLAPSCRMGRVP